MKKLILLLLCLLPLAVFAQDKKDNKVRKANYALAERFSQKHLGAMVHSTRIRPNWFRNDDRFWYSWTTSEGTRYYIADPAKGTKKEIFDPVSLAMQLTEITGDPYDAAHLPRLNLELKEDKYFQFDVTSNREKTDTAGKTEKVEYRFYLDIASQKLTWDTEKHHEKYPRWANVSPDGTLGIYLKNHNLYLMDSTSMRKAVIDPKDSTLVEKQLTFDGTGAFSWNGDNYSGDYQKDSTERSFAPVFWSPDSRRFATVRWDMSMVEELWVINSVRGKRPTLETYRYQLPGEPSPKGYLYVIDTDGNQKQFKTNAFKDQDMEIEDKPTDAEMLHREFWGRQWLGDENSFYLVRRSRDIHRTDLCRVDLDSDSTKTLVSERMNTYVETRSPRLLPGGDFLWWSERNGWANVYLYGKDGDLKRNITEGAFHVEEILGVDGNAVIVSACGVNPGENPYQMHNYRVPLSGGAMKQLDMDDMDVLAAASFDGKYLVLNCSRVDCKPTVEMVATASGKRTSLEEADFSRLVAAGYKFPQRFKVKAADGITDLYGAIYKPFDFDSTKVYPVCDYVYPGPQVEANNISWSYGMTRTDRLAQLGFIVVTVGNRGGHPNRSKWYHNYGYGNLRDYGLEDQKYALQQLCAEHPWMDVERVGIHGHSGGGFMSTAAILTYPDFFKVAVSCAGNHDNSIYNRWWSEQHHGIQEKVAKGDTTFVYHIDTNQELASRLKGHLLLVTGDIDNNVHPANTIRVVDALIRAGKRFDMLVLPGQRHGFGDMNEYFFWKMADYYTRYLMGDTQERPVDVAGLKND